MHINIHVLQKKGTLVKPLAIFPSIISADVLNFATILHQLEPDCDGFHLDIMDWHFVPNLTMGPMFIQAFIKATPKSLFIHLMIEKVEKFLSTFTPRSVDTVAFHIEAQEDISALLQTLKKKQCKKSLAINPSTPLDKLKPYLDQIDSVLLMSVNPGFSGQEFIESSFERLQQLHALRIQQKHSFEIVVDGGVDMNNIAQINQYGANQVGIASAIFGQPDYRQALRALKEESILNQSTYNS